MTTYTKVTDGPFTKLFTEPERSFEVPKNVFYASAVGFCPVRIVLDKMSPVPFEGEGRLIAAVGVGMHHVIEQKFAEKHPEVQIEKPREKYEKNPSITYEGFEVRGRCDMRSASTLVDIKCKKDLNQKKVDGLPVQENVDQALWYTKLYKKQRVCLAYANLSKFILIKDAMEQPLFVEVYFDFDEDRYDFIARKLAYCYKHLQEGKVPSKDSQFFEGCDFFCPQKGNCQKYNM